jgi:hypothetical protein
MRRSNTPRRYGRINPLRIDPHEMAERLVAIIDVVEAWREYVSDIWLQSEHVLEQARQTIRSVPYDDRVSPEAYLRNVQTLIRDLGEMLAVGCADLSALRQSLNEIREDASNVKRSI